VHGLVGENWCIEVKKDGGLVVDSGGRLRIGF